jgi:leucyl aminopeptidase
MVQFTHVAHLNQRKAADLIVLPFWQGKKLAHPACEMKEFAELFALPVQSGDFKGKEGETLVLYSRKQKHEKRVMLLGLGAEKTHSADSFRRAYAAAVKASLHKKHKTLNLLLPTEGDLEESICEGVCLTNYAFDVFKEKPAPLLTKACLIGGGKELLRRCKKTAAIISAVNYTRDLVNGNADDVNPQMLSARAEELQKEFSSIKTTVFDKKRIEKEKMGFLLAVSRGAACDPAFLVIEYRGNPSSKERTAIIGKGITYDTGGLNIKQTGQMETMKCDMAGAAAVLGTLRAAALIGLKANLVGVIATAENAIGPNSYKPGDVYRGYSGKTVEISNTDAEGRLVLADALAYTEAHLKPTRIIDLATLTGGIVIALGEEATGLFSNNDKLAKELIHAGEKTHERLWRFPLYPEYKDALKSPIADLKNSGGRKASSITAAVFLQQFIKNTPWAHLDIAGTAYLSELKPYHPTHATGVGVRLLIELLDNR